MMKMPVFESSEVGSAMAGCDGRDTASDNNCKDGADLHIFVWILLLARLCQKSIALCAKAMTLPSSLQRSYDLLLPPSKTQVTSQALISLLSIGWTKE